MLSPFAPARAGDRDDPLAANAAGVTNSAALTINANPEKNPCDGATVSACERTLILDATAARKWLVRVIATRAIQLYRQGRNRPAGPSAGDGDFNGGDKKYRKRPARPRR